MTRQESEKRIQDRVNTVQKYTDPGKDIEELIASAIWQLQVGTPGLEVVETYTAAQVIIRDTTTGTEKTYLIGTIEKNGRFEVRINEVK